MSEHTEGPFGVEYLGDYLYVTSATGVRIAECPSAAMAAQVCAALNAVHFIAKATGEAA